MTLILVKTLALMARKGAQVFMTTHNYFTLKQMQIEAQTHGMDVMCCSLSRNDKNVVLPTCVMGCSTTTS